MAKKKKANTAEDTITAKIDLTENPNPDVLIKETCGNMANLGYQLVTTFTHDNLLILVFQKTS